MAADVHRGLPVVRVTFYQVMAWIGWGYAGLLTLVMILASWRRNQ